MIFHVEVKKNLSGLCVILAISEVIFKKLMSFNRQGRHYFPKKVNTMEVSFMCILKVIR